MRSRTLLAASLAGLVSASAGCGGGDDTSAASAVRANVASFRFLPKAIELRAGGSVIWINRDKAPHTVTSEDGVAPRFDTGRLSTGASERVRFDKPGTYSYFCVFHPFMKGTVEVQ